MNHRDAVLLLPWYDSQKLEEKEMQALKEHLSGCGSCQRRLENLRSLADSMTELVPADAELAPDFFERKLKGFVQAGQSDRAKKKELSWPARFQPWIQRQSWWILGPVTALVMLLLASPLVRHFSQPAGRLLLAEAPRAGLAALELKAARRSSVWQPIPVSSQEDYKRLTIAVNLVPDDPEYSQYIFRLFQGQQDSQALSEAETEAADQVELFLEVSNLQAGTYVLRVYGKVNADKPNPKPIDIYPFEIIRE